MSLLCRALTLLLTIMVSLLPQAVHANERPMGIGPVQYEGQFPIYFRREIEQTITAAIERTHGGAVELGADECVELTCLRAAAEHADMNVVILSRASEADRDYRIEIVAYAVADARVLARSVVECNICGQRELLDAIPAKIVALHADIAATLAAKTEPSQPIMEHRRTDTRIGGWIGLSLGLAAVGTGATLWAIDGRAYRPSCEPSRIDANGACPEIYTTAVAGYVTVGLGLAALAVGTGLLIHQRRARGRVRMTASGLELRF